ncbi:MAG: hypothetical protein JRI25_13260, partial [Deltaproteobacteria bacterium]|nr:hypothetical protein [Deltaproteobacteria bacterium]
MPHAGVGQQTDQPGRNAGFGLGPLTAPVFDLLLVGGLFPLDHRDPTRHPHRLHRSPGGRIVEHTHGEGICFGRPGDAAEHFVHRHHQEPRAGLHPPGGERDRIGVGGVHPPHLPLKGGEVQEGRSTGEALELGPGNALVVEGGGDGIGQVRRDGCPPGRRSASLFRNAGRGYDIGEGVQGQHSV